MSNSERTKSFFDHLEELRFVILKIIICLFILLPVMFWLAAPAVDFLVTNCCPPGFTLKYFSPLEPFFVRMKVALLLALFCGLPYIAFQTWRFIAPALYKKERMWISRLSLMSWLLFIGGAVFCYYLILPAMMRFSLSLQTPKLQPVIGIGSFIGLTNMLLLGFGLMFQFPIAVFMLAASGIVKLETLKKQRALVLVIILTLSAILTPPDVLSQIMMTVPAYLLFEISLLLGTIAIKEQKETADSVEYTEDAYQPDDNELETNPYSAIQPVKRKLRSRNRRPRR
jgi:sec-independent protein translocase protein TatC